MLLGLRSIPGAEWNFTRDRRMTTVDRQIDDVSAMTRGEEGLVVGSNTRESRHGLETQRGTFY